MEDEMNQSILDIDFPIGMRVLAVDSDPTCLQVLEQMLRNCQYEVTATDTATKAVMILKDNLDKFDLVITDVNMPGMDVFDFIEHVSVELDIPVIILSAQSNKELVMKGLEHGAYVYLLKPVRMEELTNIWQHVFRKMCLSNDADLSDSISTDPDAEDDQVENAAEHNDQLTQRRPRVVWGIELHQKFVAAVKHLGLEKAMPKKILELMNVDGITRENIASHLQKYRLYLRRVQSVQPHDLSAPIAARDSGLENTQNPQHLGTNGSGLLNWRAALAPLPEPPSDPLPLRYPFLDEQPNLSGLHISSSGTSKGKSVVEFPPADTVPVLPEDSRRGSQRGDGLLGDVVQATTGMANSLVFSAASTSGSSGQNLQQPNDLEPVDEEMSAEADRA